MFKDVLPENAVEPGEEPGVEEGGAGGADRQPHLPRHVGRGGDLVAARNILPCQGGPDLPQLVTIIKNVAGWVSAAGRHGTTVLLAA